jgi:hypothetical protein
MFANQYGMSIGVGARQPLGFEGRPLYYVRYCLKTSGGPLNMISYFPSATAGPCRVLQLSPQISTRENCKRRKQCAPKSPSVLQALRLRAPSFDPKDLTSFSGALQKMPIWRSDQPVWDPMKLLIYL